MPILAAETSWFPHNLLDDFTDVPSERHWWAVYTRSRMEKSLALTVALEVPFYLPLVRKTKRIAGRPASRFCPCLVVTCLSMARTRNALRRWGQIEWPKCFRDASAMN